MKYVGQYYYKTNIIYILVKLDYSYIYLSSYQHVINDNE